MELVYLWVEKYKNIKKQGFNFSPKFECNYDEKNNELTIDKKEHIKNFFGENINVTAIVGENGSGKSSILELLFNNLNLQDMEKDYFFVIQHNEELRLYFFENNVLQKYMIKSVYKNEKFIFQLALLEVKNKKFNFLHDVLFIFNSTSYVENFRIEGIDSNRKNLALLDTCTPMDEKLKSIENTINMIVEDVVFKKLFNLPKEIHITIKKDFESKEYNEIIKKIKEESNQTDFKSKICKEFSFQLYNRTTNISSLEEKIKNSAPKTFEDLLKLICELPDTLNFDIFKPFLEEVEKIDKTKYNHCFVKTLNFNSTIIDFINQYNKLVNNDLNFNNLYSLDILSFNWSPNISKGQETYLFQFANLYKILKDINNNITIFIDEGEMSMHPSWQKRYIMFYVDFLKNNFSDKKIHLILSSHSPFILSDLPKENVIFLEKGKQVYPFEDKQTFGANIHTLLSHGFFMNDGLTGEFAKEKINKAITYLNQKKLLKDEIDYCEDIISIIGEPIIKNQLQRMLDSKRLSKVDKIDLIEKQIKELQKELKKQKNDNN